MSGRGPNQGKTDMSTFRAIVLIAVDNSEHSEYAFNCKYMYTPLYMHIYTYIRIYTHICTYTHIYTHIYTCETPPLAGHVTLGHAH